MRPCALAFVLCCPLLCVHAQTTGYSIGSSPASQASVVGANARRYTVTGTVFNSVTNEPIRRVLVRLNSGPEQRVAFTGPDGRFELTNVLEGGVWLSAERPGYFDPRSLDGGTHFGSEPGSAKVGPGTNDFRLFLVPESKIVGTVVDPEGEPVEGITVQAIGQQVIDGRSQWTIRGAAQTDENGVYRLDGQQPGSLMVCTSAKPLDFFGRDNSEAYPARCFPNTPDRQSAQPVELQSGQTARADFNIDLVRTYSISGVIVGGQGGQVQGFVQQEGTETFGTPIMINASTGRFVARSIPSGTWKLHFQSSEGRALVQAVQEVAVSAADVTGLQITLSAGVDIPVQIVAPQETASPSAAGAPAGAALPRSAPQQIRLIPTSGVLSEQYSSTLLPAENEAPNSESRLVIQNVSPGSYNVVAQASGNCVASIAYNGVDLSHQPLIVSSEAGSEPLLVTMRSDCATLGVTVQGERKEEDGTLIIVPEVALVEPQVQSTHPGSTVQFAGLAPGSYRVYAVSSINGLAYTDPQAMRDIPSQTVNLAANANSGISLPLYERGR